MHMALWLLAFPSDWPGQGWPGRSGAETGLVLTVEQLASLFPTLGPCFLECKMCWLLILISQTQLENLNVNVSPFFSGCLEDYLRESEVELTYQRHYTLNSLLNSHENNQIFNIRCSRPAFYFCRWENWLRGWEVFSGLTANLQPSGT